MSKAIIDAAASYFGMDPAQLANGTMTTNSGGLRFTFTVQCSDEDYLGIADRMRAMREPMDDRFLQGTGHPMAPTGEVVQTPSLQEVMRDPVAHLGRPECEELLLKACKLSNVVARKLAEHTWPKEDTEGIEARMQGAGGREVKHVDVPVEEDSGLPAAVWVDGKDLDQAQKMLASDVYNGERGEHYLVQVAMLTPEQLAKVKA